MQKPKFIWTSVLPSTVNGVLADGTVTGEFDVTWDPVSTDDFGTVGDIVTVKGIAGIIGDETLPVTCNVRVAEAVNTESTNVAPIVYSLTQNIDSTYQSDNLNAVNDGIADFQDNTSTRWSNYNNRTRSDSAALPESVEFQYSLNGTDYTSVSFSSETVQTASLGQEIAYTFDEVINPVSVRVILTQQGGTSGTHCVGLIEAEMMTYAGSVEVNASADLDGISVDGIEVSGFEADKLSYEIAGSVVTAETNVNAGITILPVYRDSVVRILTVSEDGSKTKTYEVKLSCAHKDTSIMNEKEATCTENGYTGDEVCAICGETVTVGTVISATGHRWDSGVVTKAATIEEEGIMTYTCTACGETRNETIPKLEEIKTLKVPQITVFASQNNGKIRMTGAIADFGNQDDYYRITGQGFVYMSKTLLGAKSLNVNTAGRTKVSIKTVGSTGTYSYSMTSKTSSAVYVIRAYLTYTNSNGKTIYVYSDPIYTSYGSLTE